MELLEKKVNTKFIPLTFVHVKSQPNEFYNKSSRNVSVVCKNLDNKRYLSSEYYKLIHKPI